jgi:tRNA(adenine34) deaminase
MSDPVDSRMMQRCLALAMEAADRGEQPYAAVICRDGQFVCEAINSVRYDRDVTRHAELAALSDAFRRLNRTSLEDCTIYSNAEPCALCCYAMRECRIGRVVYAVPAPLTGGVSRWAILSDDELSDRLPEVFAPAPEIVPGFMREEAERALARRAPLAWRFLSGRNIFGGPLPASVLAAAAKHRRASVTDRAMAFLRRHLFDRFGRR